MTRPRALYISLNVASACILIMGLFASVLIYRGADRESADAVIYEQGNDSAHPVSPYDTKKYLRDMELYGGKANVLAAELRLWLAGLWQGKTLAYTIAFLSVLVSFTLSYGAGRLTRHPSDSYEADRGREDGGP